MNPSAYFERIAYTGDTAPTLDNLRAIHRAHLYAVPFENLDIHIQRPIILDEARLFDKIVHMRRGGFCFEQNGLFYRVLTESGYQVDRVEANVYSGHGTYSIPMSHMTLIVHLDGQRWLADVGFGASFVEPLQIDTPQTQTQDGQDYRIRRQDATYYYEARKADDDTWQIQYRFFDTPRTLNDFDEACHYMQTSPESHFTQKRICSLARPDGRISLSDNLCIHTHRGQRTEITLPDEQAIREHLLREFGVDLSISQPD